MPHALMKDNRDVRAEAETMATNLSASALSTQAGIQPAHGPEDGPCQWERTTPADPDVPPRPVLLLHAIAERQRWKAEYTAAQLAVGEPPGQNLSATGDQAA